MCIRDSNEQLPKSENVKNMNEYTTNIIEFNSKVWNEKKEKNLSLKDSIKMEIPKELEIFRKDLTAMHNIKSD